MQAVKNYNHKIIIDMFICTSEKGICLFERLKKQLLYFVDQKSSELNGNLRPLLFNAWFSRKGWEIES